MTEKQRDFEETDFRLSADCVRLLAEISQVEETDMTAALNQIVNEAAYDRGLGNPAEETWTIDANDRETFTIGRERHQFYRKRHEGMNARDISWIDDIQSENASIHLEQMNEEKYFLRIGQLEFDIVGKDIRCLVREDSILNSQSMYYDDVLCENTK